MSLSNTSTPDEITEATMSSTRDKTTPHRTRVQERMDEIDISPTKLLADIDQLKTELDAAKSETAQYLGALQRERAEFQNYRRRTTEERERDAGLAFEGLRPVHGGEGPEVGWHPGQDRGWQELHAARDQRDDPPEAQVGCRGIPWRKGHRGSYHRPGLLRRYAAPGDQGCRPDRGPRGQADPARTDRLGPRVWPRQEGRREGRGLRPGRRHVRH